MKQGDLFFIKNEGIYGKLINHYNKRKFKTNGPTHVGIIISCDKENVIIYEALNRGFVANNYERWWLDLKIKQGVVFIKRPIYNLKNVKENSDKYLGKKYGWYDIFKIGLFYLFGFKGIYFTGANKIICSEAVSRILYDCSDKKIKLGYDKRKNKKDSEYKIPFDLITPMHVYKSKYMKYIKK